MPEPPTLVDPFYEYDHGTGHAITGGYVYRGGRLPASFVGWYFFADFEAGRVWALEPVVDAATGETSAGSLIELTSALGGSSVLGLISSFGVDAIHIWAYPNPGSGAAPIFLGATVPTFARPDVAAAFGSQFTNCGFGLTAGAALSPGTYDVVVYARSTVTGTFNNAQFARITVN